LEENEKEGDGDNEEGDVGSLDGGDECYGGDSYGVGGREE